MTKESSYNIFVFFKSIIFENNPLLLLNKMFPS